MKRTTLLAALCTFAILWTWLMGFGVARTLPTGAQPAIELDNEEALPVDGVGARITYVDDTQFPDITVYLAVNDSEGEPAFGLDQDNFTLYEDSAEVAITDFTAAGGQAATVLLIIDHSGSMDDDDKMAGASQAANTFIKQLQSGYDRVGVMIFDDRIDVLATLDIITDDQKEPLQQLISQVQPRGYTQFYATVQEAIQQITTESGRKVVVALTDGNDDDGQTRLEETIERATAANVPIYTIGLGGDVDQEGLEPLAVRSGGAYYFSPSADELEALYAEIGSTLRNEYALVYKSTTPNLDGTRRDLAVDVVAGGEQLSTSGDYQVGGVLASSFSWTLFLPLFLGLLAGLIALYKLPTLRRRSSTPDEVVDRPTTDEPSLEPHISSQPTVTVPVAPASIQATLTAAKVTQRHARIGQLEGRYVLDDLSGGQSFVSYSGDPGQLRQVQRNALKDGSLLQLGEVQVTFRERRTEVWLEQVYELSTANSATTTVGSALDNDIVVPIGTPHQAQIAQEEGRWVVTNLAGEGLWVSYSGDPALAQPVSGRNALKDGSMVRVGETVLFLKV